MSNLRKINTAIQICMVILYVVVAIGIWFLPMLTHSRIELKVLLSICLVSYATIRFLRFKKRRDREEKENNDQN